MIFLAALLAAQVQTVQGTVDIVDRDLSTLTVTTREAATGHIRITGAGVDIDVPGSRELVTTTLQARPIDIARIESGDLVSISFVDYGGVAWIEPSSAQQTVTDPRTDDGTVTRVFLSSGMLELNDGALLVHAHPSQLAALLPGEAVRVTWGTVGDARWANAIEPSGAL